MRPKKTTVLILTLALFAPALQGQTPFQKQSASHPTSQKSPAPKVKAEDQKFGFGMLSVEPDELKGYHVEGVTIDGWRLVLSCPTSPPEETLKGLSGDERAKKFEEYKDSERFRNMAAVASIDKPRTPKGFGRMTLYRARFLEPDMPEKEQNEVIRNPYQIVVAHCWLINEVENGEDAFPVKVLSSEFRNWKDGKGYEVDAQTTDELLTLGCTEGKGTACQSLPANGYRATRNGSMVRVYDKDLNLMGSYRILSERTAK